MAELKCGNVTITYGGEFTIPEQAGKLTPAQSRRVTRARRGIGVAGADTADAMTKHPTRLNVPGVTAAEVLAATMSAEAVDRVIVDIEGALTVFKQANLLLDNEAHEKLRRVLSFVRSQEKFDAKLAETVPGLIKYFAHAEKAEKAEAESDTETTPESK